MRIVVEHYRAHVAPLLEGQAKAMVVVASRLEAVRWTLMNAIMEALDAHTQMSKQALESEAVRSGIKVILLHHARLWEALRAKARAGRTSG
ncbi:MAG TPA: hypothetical protein VFZ09_00045 [Archangium sp.]|uniref:hypothetical protein n=1 Tax=Archangium sp. TaxID=1872627 RepID=UPI002E3055D2|nr:hypothetical protein [Archangium sp.]HEX5744595.1 hypothetical protein [Archangium sp.]